MPICTFSRGLCVKYIHYNNIKNLLLLLSGNKMFLIYNYYIKNYILPYRNGCGLNLYILSSPYIIIVIRIFDAINLAYIYAIFLNSWWFKDVKNDNPKYSDPRYTVDFCTVPPGLFFFIFPLRTFGLLLLLRQ